MSRKNIIFSLLVLAGVLATVVIVKFTTESGVMPWSSPQASVAVMVRPAAAAGQFYPKDAGEIRSQIKGYLDKAKVMEMEGKLRILIAPHAGINYSGATAGWGFKQLKEQSYSRVILLGSSHKVSLNKAAVFSQGEWQTPLGSVKVDEDWAKRLLDGKQIVANTEAHEEEHSLELELIFLQEVLSEFEIVPILLGQPNEELTELLAQKIAWLMDEQTLLVISTDLSHYPLMETAAEVDKQVIEAILTGKQKELETTVARLEAEDYPQLDTCACGLDVLRVGLRVAELLEIGDFELFKYENSGEVGGDVNQVVGYATIGGYSQKLPSNQLSEAVQEEALELARETVETYLEQGEVPSITPENQELNRPLGAFVTLRKQGQLRGCIGSFEPDKPLFQVIQDMVIAAAIKDQRFSPVTAVELEEIEIEISVMTPKRKVDSWEEIELGRHGVVLEKGERAGTFLPQVAEETGWSKEEFLSQLCSQKAGLDSDCYQDSGVNLYVFEAQIFEEK